MHRKVQDGLPGPSRLRSGRRRKIVALLVGFFGNGCYYCGRDFVGEAVRLRTLDHRVPLCRGGTNEMSNLVLCCTKCNNAKGDMTDAEYVTTSGYALRRQWQDQQRKKKPRVKVELIDSLAVA